MNIFNSEQSKKFLPLLLPAVAGLALFMLSKDSAFIIVTGIIILIIMIVASLMTFKLIEDHNKLLAENEKLKNNIRDNEVFVDIATSVSIPKFIVSSDGKLYWTNIDANDYDIDLTRESFVDSLVTSPAAAAAIEKCLKRNLIATYEVEMGYGEKKVSLNITLSKIKYKNDENAIYGNITNTSEHQRELSMQAEMLSLCLAAAPAAALSASRQFSPRYLPATAFSNREVPGFSVAASTALSKSLCGMSEKKPDSMFTTMRVPSASMPSFSIRSTGRNMAVFTPVPSTMPAKSEP